MLKSKCKVNYTNFKREDIGGKQNKRIPKRKKSDAR